MKKKLYRIGNSKEPTLDQLQRMTHNLQTVYNRYALIEVKVWKHSDKSKEIEYWLGMGDTTFNNIIKTWPEVLATYKRLMKEAKSV